MKTRGSFPGSGPCPRAFFEEKRNEQAEAERRVLSLHSLCITRGARRGAEPRPRFLGALPGRSQGGGRRTAASAPLRELELFFLSESDETQSRLLSEATARGPFSPSAGAPPPPRVQTASGPVGRSRGVFWPGFLSCKVLPGKSSGKGLGAFLGGGPLWLSRISADRREGDLAYIPQRWGEARLISLIWESQKQSGERY